MTSFKKQFNIKLMKKIINNRYKYQPQLKETKLNLFLRQIEQLSRKKTNDQVEVSNSLTQEEKIRWSRQLRNPILNQEKIKNAKISVFGLGGIGSNVLLNLAYVGVSNLALIDYDRIELSNLNRQTLYTPKDIGRFKTESAQKRLLQINPDITSEIYNLELDYPKGIELLNFPPNEYPERISILNSIISNSDIVINAMDYKGAPYLINDLCVKNKKPFYWAGINYFLGEIYCYFPSKETACIRDIFHPNEPLFNQSFLRYKEQNQGLNKSSYSLGIIAIIIGSLISNLILFDINEVNHPYHGYYLMYDGFNIELMKIPIQKRKDCLCQNR
ncbi:MAG: putative Adenylyltransferase [Promethearchaeota archaeon]|nr:MAG: putative Adenylyltransferase [Candidatus Lokiarchaeota archaeon]